MKHLGSIAETKDVVTKEYADSGKIWFGTCDTAAATQTKAVTISGITALTAGLIILVSFTNYQNYNGAPKLNLNSLGAATIRRINGTSAARYEWQSGEILPLYYDGTYWVLWNGGLATTTYYGVTKLSSSAISTSTAVAMTPSALNGTMQNLVTGYPPYDSSATYAVGDKVRYGTYAYECSTAITTAEAWNADHWTALPNLQSQIDSIDVSGKADKPSSYTAGNIAVLDSNGNYADGGLSFSVVVGILRITY